MPWDIFFSNDYINASHYFSISFKREIIFYQRLFYSRQQFFILIVGSGAKFDSYTFIHMFDSQLEMSQSLWHPGFYSNSFNQTNCLESYQLSIKPGIGAETTSVTHIYQEIGRRMQACYSPEPLSGVWWYISAVFWLMRLSAAILQKIKSFLQASSRSWW